MLAMLAGTLVLVAGLDPGANAGIVLIPMALMGLGIGALASQLGAVTVSAVPDDQSAEVGGLQNTFTNFGASLGTALVGAVLIGSLTTGFIAGVSHNPAIPPQVTAKATVQLESGVPFVSDTDLRTALRRPTCPPPPRTPSWRRTPPPGWSGCGVPSGWSPSSPWSVSSSPACFPGERSKQCREDRRRPDPVPPAKEIPALICDFPGLPAGIAGQG